MSLNLKIEVREVSSVPVMDLDGEVDVYTYPQLNEAINKVINDNKHHIVINLEKVKYIDSTGLGVLASSANKISPKNGMLHVICNQSQIKKIFIVSGLLEKNFKLYDAESEAIAAIG